MALMMGFFVTRTFDGGRLNDVSKECQLCGSTGPHQTISVREMMFGTRERFEYYSCAECDTLQTVNLLGEEELARHYGPDYYSYNVSAEPRVLRWLTTQHDRFDLRTGGRFAGALSTSLVPDRVVKMFGQLQIERDAHILDVGCGGGKLLDRLARAGFSNLSGADPFIEADCETTLGVPLLKRHLDDVVGEFDLIMFNHSLEHVPHPIATLKTANEKLAGGGICLIRVPTTSSEAWKTYQADWVQIDAPRHIVIPSRKGMARAADKAGLRVEKTIDDSFSFQFLGSEQYRRDVPLFDPRGRKLFGPKQIWDWEKEADRLNRRGRGDQAAFVLRAR
jgi:SAM-dependent methyltransferase